MAVFDEHQNVIMGAAGAGGYSVDNSIVLDDGSSQYLTRTPSAAGNLKTFTVSFWFKRGNLGIVTYLLKRRTAALGFIRINADDTLTYYNEAGGVAIQLITTQVFRDPHSWYHLVVVQDTTQATASDRAKMYLNGSEITAFNTAQYNIAQNGDGTLFDADTLDIGQASTQFWDGYLSEYCYIDGTALTETSFGEYNTNGVWRPIDVAASLATNLTLSSVAQGAGTAIGDMTNTTAGNSLAAAFDGIFGGNDGANNASKRTSVTDAFVGKDWGSGVTKVITGFSTRDVNNAGYFDDTSEGRFYLYGSNSAPSTYNDGTLLYTGDLFNSTIAAQEHYHFDTENFDTSTAYRYHWVALVPTSTVTNVRMAELYFYEDGGNFGTNGFYLDFAASGDLGNDVSGNANDFTTSGAPTQSSDTPTNNSATLTTIDGSGATFSNGNLVVGSNTTNSYKGGTGCIGLAPGSGSWYVEALCTGATGSNKEYVFGAATNDTDKSVAGYFPGSATYSNDDEHGYYSGSGGIVYNGSSSTGSVGTYGDGNTVALRFDMDVTTPTCKFYVNDTLKHTANLTVGKTYYPHFNTQDLNLTFTVNFGTTSFTYTLPTGHLAINTTNLPAPTIADPSAHFQVTTYTGDGVAIGSGGQEINQSGNSTFQPDFVWIKNSSASTADHWAFDAIRGATKYLEISDSTAETTDTESLTSFDADGFTVGSDPFVNNSGDNHVAWCWKANGSGSSNSDGSITSTVSANQTSGFSIVTYTGNSSASTVGHGLGVAPAMIIVKKRSGTANDWAVWNKNLSVDQILLLNSTAAAYDPADNDFQDTAPTSSVFYITATNGRTNSSGEDFVAYCFAEVEGFSKFGSFTGNGSTTDGPFIYTGFKPAFFMWKRTDSGTNGDWTMMDNKRDPVNMVERNLRANSTIADDTGEADLDFVSNGIKHRGGVSARFNQNGANYIYAAFAETPFQGGSTEVTQGRAR